MMSDAFSTWVFPKNAGLVFGFQSSGTGDDFNQLSSDDSLTGTVECHRQFINHLTLRRDKVDQ
jgi:hypothetical protein